MVRGSRQVGKTYIIEKFCKENYKNYVYINFYENESYNTIFEDSLNAEDIINKIKVKLPYIEIIPHETVIFLDEIQECPNAITALKFLTINNSYDIISSDSLLGINYKEVKSYPVGYVEYLEMHSLDFEEFCMANGIRKNTLEELKYYFGHNSTLEIDFIISVNKKVTGIEVKSADNTKSKSLNSLINNWGVECEIKLSSKNIGKKDKITSYPIYMAIFL